MAKVKSDEERLEELKTKRDALDEEWEKCFFMMDRGDPEAKKKRASLTAKNNRLSKQIDEIESRISEREITNKVLTANKENSLLHRIDKNTRTVPIIDEFFSSDKDRLLLSGVIPVRNYWDTYLVIIKDHKYIRSAYKDDLTMTDLKKDAYDAIKKVKYNGIEIIKPYTPPWDRLYSLCMQLNAENLKILEEEKHLIFTSPVELKAQTSGCRKGFGTTAYYESWYGQALEFYIIGAIIL